MSATVGEYVAEMQNKYINGVITHLTENNLIDVDRALDISTIDFCYCQDCYVHSVAALKVLADEVRRLKRICGRKSSSGKG